MLTRVSFVIYHYLVLDHTLSCDIHDNDNIMICYRSIQVDSKTIKAQIWDTAGQERYRAITSA